MTVAFEATSLGPPPALDLRRTVERRQIDLDAGIEPAFTAHGAATANVQRIFADGALCITTGQQPGLLTGPLYTVYKALSAAALAQVLESKLERPVVPVFWVAGDDHDFAEANHLHLTTAANTVERVTLRQRDQAAQQPPLYREPVGHDIRQVMETVARETPETEYKSEIIDWLQRHYRESADLATAFGDSMAELLGRHGVVVFNPTHPAAKKSMAQWCVKALANAPDINAALVERATMLEEDGFTVPIAVGDGATTVMIESSMGRDRLVLDGDGFTARRSGERWSLDELEKVARSEPERLSANVLLRPVVEAATIPTLAYVAGPGELKYLSQADPIYRALDVEPQERVARWAGRVVEARVTKVLNKYGIAADDLNAPEGQLEARLLRDEMPSDAVRAIANLRSALNTEYESLAAAASGIDSTLEKPVHSAGHNALRGVADVEKRIISQLKKQNEIVVQQLAKARISLFPLGKPQERVLNIVPFLVRYGPSFIDSAYESCLEWAGALETTSSQA
jgi:bacillithiol biosynthesis cysteine-adding enzyme BshC